MHKIWIRTASNNYSFLRLTPLIIPFLANGEVAQGSQIEQQNVVFVQRSEQLLSSESWGNQRFKDLDRMTEETSTAGEMTRKNLDFNNLIKCLQQLSSFQSKFSTDYFHSVLISTVYECTWLRFIGSKQFILHIKNTKRNWIEQFQYSRIICQSYKEQQFLNW